MKCDLAVDTNYILFKNVFTLTKLKTLYGDLERSLEVAFEKYIKKYPWDTIYLISDSKKYSWRKQFLETYKSDRKKDADIDWEFVFNTYDQFKNNMSENKRIVTLESDSIEGDDWIYYVVSKNMKNKRSTVFVASDGDLQQLLDFRIGEKWINIQWKDNFRDNKVYMPNGYRLLMDEIEKNSSDNLFNPTNDVDFIEMISEWESTSTIQEVDKEEILFTKIVKGDKSDSIKSILETETKTGKMMGIGDAGADKIYNRYKDVYSEDIDFSKDLWIRRLIPFIAEYKKVDIDKEVVEKIENNIIKNRMLIHLNHEWYPSEVKQIIKETYKLSK